MRPPKKSETLEVRLSYLDKRALQEQAAREGRTVSDVVRGLIASYLSQNEARSKLSFLSELLMTIKSRPRAALTVLLACLPILALPTFFATPANAEDISMSLEGEFVSPITENGVEGKRTRRFNTEIELELDQFLAIQLPSLMYQGPDSTLIMVAQITEVGARVKIHITLCETAATPMENPAANIIGRTDLCEGQRVLAQPTISTLYGELAEFKMEDQSGESFRLTAQPRRL